MAIGMVGHEAPQLGTTPRPPSATPEGARQNSVALVTAPPFISPAVKVDDSGLAVLVIRDGDSGEVKVQIPSEEVVRQYARNERPQPVAAPQPAPASEPAAEAAEPAAETPVEVSA